MNQLNIFEKSWVDIEGYEGYYQSNGKGDVMNKQTGRILKAQKIGGGYVKVSLYKNGKSKQPLVHRLAWESFYGKIPDGMVIDHIDGNPSNNDITNLRCVSQKENCNNPITKERSKKYKNDVWKKNITEAAKKSNSKPVLQLDLNGKPIREWNSMMDVERELGFCHSFIARCCKGKCKQAYGFIWKYAS